MLSGSRKFFFSGKGCFESGKGGFAKLEVVGPVWFLKKSKNDLSAPWLFWAIAAVYLWAPKSVLFFLGCYFTLSLSMLKSLFLGDCLFNPKNVSLLGLLLPKESLLSSSLLPIREPMDWVEFCLLMVVFCLNLGLDYFFIREGTYPPSSSKTSSRPGIKIWITSEIEHRWFGN